jgi:sortase A
MSDKNHHNEPRHLSARDKKVIQPIHDDLQVELNSANPAADLIRKKLNTLYEDEPKAKEEIAEVDEVEHRSKHQQFMYDLSHSGKSLAEIQTAWHQYYVNLPNDEKHQVWQEFYANYQPASHTQTHHEHLPKATISPTAQKHHAKKPDARTVKDIKDQLLGTVQTRTKIQKKHHLQSLIFGLGMGSLVLLIFLFGFFNERFIAPFITPSRSVSSTPIVIDPANSAVGSEPKIIIPKINVEIPVIYDEPTINEAAIQRALETGVVHYPTTSNPGEIGNGVIFGHSANNILNKGKYKFAFVLLKRLEAGDTFYVQKDGKRYVYKVFDKKIVKPTEVSVLYPSYPDKPSTFTLITCDPPGTSLNRLVVVGEQISPDPSANVASTAKQASTQPAQLPSNSPTLWSRITGWFSGD